MKKTVRINLKTKIFALTVLPLLILGTVTMLIATDYVKDALLDEIREALQSAATATFAAYDQNSGDYILADNGDVWKGSYNISKSESIVDSIKEKSGMEVTFFYGDKRIMTSAKDKNGKRILGSPAGETVKKKVLEQGKEYFSKAVSIDGIIHYGYYMPVYQTGQEKPIGMIFVGTNKGEKDATINRIVNTIILVVLVVMLICVGAAAVFAISTTRSLKKSIRSVQLVASGDLNGNVDAKLFKRGDEIGDLSRAVVELQEEMKKSISAISTHAQEVLSASDELRDTAKETTSSMVEVENAVNSIAQSATDQAEMSGRASDHITDMGEKIQQTSEEVKLMEKNAKAMRLSEEKTADTIQKLLQSNREVQELIGEIARQTKETNESAKKINEVAQMIASIADETNLLSLNAGIEAARAGESGRGFAVVANQIQNLANQSNDSSRRIEEIIHQLMEDSDQAVATMEKVTETINTQTNHMQETEQMTGEVMHCIMESVGSMKAIEKRVSNLDGSRQAIVATMEELLDIARQNAATTQEVCATANVVNENVEQVAGSTDGLKEIADGLKASMQHFQI
ncbi:MAG: methyl-accepting chemotaxis protein [Clostridiales bacterium]|nr:methyl-accepting chemotaxis protein [Clostridiales bacterium]